MSALRNRLTGTSGRTDHPLSDWRNTRETFGLCARIFHAVMAVAILVMLGMGFLLDSLPQSLRNGGYIVHMGLGLWILLGAILWFGSWLLQPTPYPLPTQSRANFRVAKLVHKLLFVLCIVMPVTGWIMASAWGNTSIAIAPFVHIPAVTYKDPDFAKAMLGLHIVVAWTIIGLLSLHIAGALYHVLIKRDDIVKRILPPLPRLRRPRRKRFDTVVHKARFKR